MYRNPLKVRKEPWRNTSNPNVMRGLPLSPNASVEAHYAHMLDLLILRMTMETKRAIEGMFSGKAAQEYFAEDGGIEFWDRLVATMDASIASQARILASALRKKFDKLFADAAPPIAETLVARSDKTASASLHTSIQRMTAGVTLPTTALQGPLGEILQASIQENVALIKSIPQKYLSGVEGAVMRSITIGNGLQDLVPYLANAKGVTLRRARFIAADQTKKVFENITTARMKTLGLQRFEWLHVASNHPRRTHLAMAGNIYNIDEGAYDSDVERNVMPGELPGCRCKKIPILEIGTVK